MKLGQESLHGAVHGIDRHPRQAGGFGLALATNQHQANGGPGFRSIKGILRQGIEARGRDFWQDRLTPR